jgi:hypothetical protein
MFAAELKKFAPGGGFISMGDTEYIRADLARALIDTNAERDALRERVAKLRDALEGIAGSDDPYEPCGWAINTARAALQEDTPND